ncbi:poly-beta-1,6-N-acetyl-D-glucosamine N-deacetylase PgaB [Acinetobacter pragensis]|uniref:poly-beta-1,6-N-acetyl-D-glucosamine N-deacetylase PgaB n=1 Tax=Acinetobacter pragensis TaxID=1806892 RepID=UPI003340792C
MRCTYLNNKPTKKPIAVHSPPAITPFKSGTSVLFQRWSLTAALGFILSGCASTDTVRIQPHPIDALVQQYAKTAHRQPTEGSNTASKLKNMRIMHIDLDYIYDQDQAQQTRNIQALIQRIQVIQPNSVFLQAFADPDANGSADAVYFPNRHIPMREGLFQRVLQQIRQSTEVDAVYAWLPLIAWEFPEQYKLRYVQNRGEKKGYVRISPFDVKNQRYTAEIFLDFIQHNQVDGILYHDDITLSDFEDASAPALLAYQQWGFEGASLIAQPKHPQQLKFAQHKTAYLDQFAAGISDILKQQQPNLRFARNMYAEAVLNPASEKWFSQSNASTYRHYDYNAIMAMPYMEKADDHRQFYLNLIQQAKKYDPNLSRTIFELQVTDWNHQNKISDEELIATIALLEQQGVQHIGYYPDDFAEGHPNAQRLKTAFAQAE